MMPTCSTAEAEKAFGLPLHPGWLGRYARAGKVTPAGRSAGGRYQWDMEDLARQFTVLGNRRLSWDASAKEIVVGDRK
jgi:hypothetical protein